MRIQCQQLGKKYQDEWIFRDFNYEFESGGTYAVHGNNGAGKSTLLRCLSGHASVSKGVMKVETPSTKIISPDRLFEHLVYVAPYIDLIEEFTLLELLEFHFRFKQMRSGWTLDSILEYTELVKVRHRPIQQFSSGMKQRVKLATALFSQASLVLLDEPTTNLDASGIEWYRHLVQTTTKNDILLIASNATDDFDFCKEHIEITDYKPAYTRTMIQL